MDPDEAKHAEAMDMAHRIGFALRLAEQRPVLDAAALEQHLRAEAAAAAATDATMPPAAAAGVRAAEAQPAAAFCEEEASSFRKAWVATFHDKPLHVFNFGNGVRLKLRSRSPVPLCVRVAGVPVLLRPLGTLYYAFCFLIKFTLCCANDNPWLPSLLRAPMLRFALAGHSWLCRMYEFIMPNAHAEDIQIMQDAQRDVAEDLAKYEVRAWALRVRFVALCHALASTDITR
jgi:hypothetical protein